MSVQAEVTNAPSHPRSGDGVQSAARTSRKAVPARRAPGRARRISAVAIPPVLAFVAFIGLWYAVRYVVVSPEKRFLVPTPWRVLQVGFLDHANFTEILRGTMLSAEVAGIGLILAVTVGFLTAIAMSQAKWVERAVYPYAVVLQTVPILALVPLIGLWFGFGLSSRVIVCVLVAVFPIMANTLFGLQSADVGQRELFRLHQASRMTVLLKLELPAAQPAIFAGLRISAGLSVIGAVVGDFFFKQGDPGIGILIDLYRSRLQSEQLFAATIMASLLGVAAFVFFDVISRRVVGRWYEPESR